MNVLKVIILLAKIRNEKKISLERLSKMSGVSKAHLSDIERNLKMPSLLVMIRLSQALKVSITDLYEVIQ